MLPGLSSVCAMMFPTPAEYPVIPAEPEAVQVKVAAAILDVIEMAVDEPEQIVSASEGFETEGTGLTVTW